MLLRAMYTNSNVLLSHINDKQQMQFSSNLYWKPETVTLLLLPTFSLIIQQVY